MANHRGRYGSTSTASPIIARDTVGGVEISTVFIAEGGHWETCLFDNRNGRRFGGPSQPVESYSSEPDAVAGHRKWAGTPTDTLVATIARRFE